MVSQQAAPDGHRVGAFQDHPSVIRPVALPEQDFAQLDRLNLAVQCEQVHLVVRQLREQRRVVPVQ